MKIVVSGLWHLGCVTAACLAEHYSVVGHDPDGAVIADLQRGKAPLFEPGLDDLIASGIQSGSLSFTSAPDCAAHADVVWITHDTPVDDEDRSDVEFVAYHARALIRLIRPGTLVLVSSQVPVGFVARIEAAMEADGVVAAIAYVPENLRLGQALRVFRQPDRIVAGVRRDTDRARLAALLAPFCETIVWMSPESAEMTKHALNAFLATSVTFINEVAGICEAVGADVKDVERGLKSDVRIGPLAYLSAGTGFAGGTLARDVNVLTALGHTLSAPVNVLDGVLRANSVQQRWAEGILLRELGSPSEARIAILGLTYKPGTDTLRRSAAIELARRLAERGAAVTAYDPAVHSLPEELGGVVRLAASVDEALSGADAAVVGTEWPEFRALTMQTLQPMRRRLVIDPTRFLNPALRASPGVRYFAVGVAAQHQMETI